MSGHHADASMYRGEKGFVLLNSGRQLGGKRDQVRSDCGGNDKYVVADQPSSRVRFARLSRIRTILGCPPEEDDIPDDAHKFVEDGEYLALDLSIHWVSLFAKMC